MNKLKFDVERYCRHNTGRMGKWSVTGEDIATLIADEIKTLRAAVDLHGQGAVLLREELRALKASNQGQHILMAELVLLRAELAALKEAASRSLDDAYNSFADREEAHEHLVGLAKLIVKSWNTVELGDLKEAIEDMAALVGEG